MKADDRSRVSELFLRASRLEPDDRAAYLDSACGDDGSLRGAVDALLSSDARSLDAVDDGVLATHLLNDDEALPESIGPFTVLKRLGAGGMGTVYRAEQHEPIHREVAVKVIRLETDAPQVLARFHAECQALARMHHPNVAQILEVGVTDEHRPYFAMEFIDGETITRYCENGRLSVRQRLELFARVCDGVQHAHQKAVIHRDIKPSNVLITEIDGKPTPKLIDFGVAKAADDAPLGKRTLHTVVGQMLGTLEYMSPEQAEGPTERVDTRSDVYSLGVLLYELLVGELPYDVEASRSIGMSEMLRRIREDEPVWPSKRLTAGGASADGGRSAEVRTQTRKLRGDLDLITMKALEKDPTRRYDSPAALAADIRRHLNDEPVLVTPPSAVNRARRFVRRHPTGVGLSLAGVLVLIGFSWAMWHQRNIAIAKTRDAEAILDAMVNIVNVAEPYASGPFNYMARGALEAELTDRKDLRLILDARMSNKSGLLELLPKLRSELGPKHPETLRAIHRAATGHDPRLDGATRVAMLREVLAARLSSRGPQDPETLNTRTDLGRWYTQDRNLEESERELTLATTGLDRQVGEDHPYRLRAHAYRSATLMFLGRWDEAHGVLSSIVPRMRRVMRLDMVTQHALYNLACCLAQHGDADAAVESLRESVDWGLDLHGRVYDDPDLAPLKGNPRFEMVVGETGYYTSLAAAESETQFGRYSSAIEHLKEAVRRGFDNAEVLRNDMRFSFLFEEPAFIELLERLES